ncbi:MAG: hypothetical protein AABW59_03400 [archaeon]
MTPAPKRAAPVAVKRERALPIELTKWAGTERHTERNNAHELASKIGMQNTVLFSDMGGHRSAGLFLYNTHPIDASRFIMELGGNDAHKGVMRASELVKEKMSQNTKGGFAIDAAEFVTRFRPEGAALLVRTHGAEKVRTHFRELIALKKKETKENSHLTFRAAEKILK